MSKRKRVTPNYQQLYQQEQNRAWKLERENRELERRVSRQQVIADQIAESTRRTQQEIYNVQRQVVKAERQAAAERASLADLQQRVLQDVAGVRVDLREVHSAVDASRWENQELHQMAQRSRDQIRQAILNGFDENRQLHELAQQQRQLIENAVNRNAEMLEQNHRAIETSRQQIEERIRETVEAVRDQELKRELELMRSAARIIEQAVQHRDSVPRSWAESFEPEAFNEASKLVAGAIENFEDRHFEAAIGAGTAALDRISDVAGQIRRAQAEYQRHWERARDAYDETAQKIGELNTRDEVRLWAEPRLDNLKKQFQELKEQWVQASLEDMTFTQDSLDQIRSMAQSLYQEARAIENEVDESEERDFKRLTDVQQYVAALEAMSRAVSERPYYTDPNDPHSEIVIESEDGLQIKLNLNGEVRTEFPLNSTANENVEWMEMFSRQCERMGFAGLGFREIPG